MGSMQSSLSSEAALMAVVVVAAAGFGYYQLVVRRVPTPSKTVKKQKAKPAAISPLQPSLAKRSDSVPGAFEDEPLTPAAAEKKPAKKSKKKKATSALAPSSSTPQPDSEAEATPKPETPPSRTATPPTSKRAAKRQRKQQEQQDEPALATPVDVDTDSSWTRVEARHRDSRAAATGYASTSTDTSDAAAAHDDLHSEHALPTDSEPSRTLAERLFPRAPQTDVDDMLEDADRTALARVLRVQPRSDEQPASGFSWGDYEDVEASADDDDGWGVVKSRNRKQHDPPSAGHQQAVHAAQKAPETLTKRQRQNASRRDAEKAAKAEAEMQRLAKLAQHKRELERIRIAEQSKSKGKQVSGGMKAVVDESGRLVWE
ncbi:hypothetical protein FISHEDRAFT_75651 [Fistulina hepatica ATCC 64428]|uniref:Uncharacterized protein n=1 Tax=Fistulina hepatica ATCC 64428 TaxID=1128425 RepID=A0A0D7A6Q7_9AGAR|nr:hypothetical protein FISHEDRAFT_75651 [Fistulina hepatica ATCC 64428]